MPIRKEILYPSLLKCSKLADNNYWNNIFEDMSYGICPYGAYISKDFLCCNYKKREFSYKIDTTKTNEVLYKEIHNLLSNKLGCMSNAQRKNKKLEYDKLQSNIRNLGSDWSTIRKKNTRDILIELFVLKKQKQHNLSLKQAKLLLSIIFISMVFKVISSKDITFNNREIQSISGIDFDNKKIVYSKKLFDTNDKKEIEFSNKIINDSKKMKHVWDKYILDIQKMEFTIT